MIVLMANLLKFSVLMRVLLQKKNYKVTIGKKGSH